MTPDRPHREIAGDPILLDLLRLSVEENATNIAAAAGSAVVQPLEWGVALQAEATRRLLPAKGPVWIVGSDVRSV
jgi:hypothetical protein